MQINSIVHGDDKVGRVVGFEAENVVVDFDDGSSSIFSVDKLILQPDGTYNISSIVKRVEITDQQEMVIPVVQEELTVIKEKIERAKVLINKRIETRDEVVSTPTTTEEVVVEHIPIERIIEDQVPEIREEDGVLIIPIIEEITVVEKRLFLKEEVRISKRHKTSDSSQTVTLRKEIVDIARTEINQPIDQ
jgi:hypothetical protein